MNFTFCTLFLSDLQGVAAKRSCRKKPGTIPHIPPRSPQTRTPTNQNSRHTLSNAHPRCRKNDPHTAAPSLRHRKDAKRISRTNVPPPRLIIQRTGNTDFTLRDYSGKWRWI